MDRDFTDEQKQYLAGFMSGYQAVCQARGMATFAQTLGLTSTGNTPAVTTNIQGQPAAPTNVTPQEPGNLPVRPESIHFEAQARFLAAGKKLTAEEEAKRRQSPLDLWDVIQQHADAKKFPKGTDVFLFKYHGLFYVAPAQDSFMCRLRFAGGDIKSYQMRAVAQLAADYGGGYVHVTTRANLQIREIRPENAPALLMGLQEAGIVSRGAGADNIRNITASPIAGRDPQELIDTMPLARQLHHYILQHRELYGLPRKFNIAYDGGGVTSVLEDTNDIGFAAVRVPNQCGVPEGVYFRLQLGGITGHKDFARDTGILLQPEECLPAAVALVKAFCEHGDRTDRKKARLKYVLEKLGVEGFLAAAEKYLGKPWRRFPLADCLPRGPVMRDAHVGIHPQRQTGRFYIGIVVPVGHLTVDQLQGLADLADRYGSGILRLTVWQNLVMPDIAASELAEVQARLLDLGLSWNAGPIRSGLVACTGNRGCKFANSDTKGHALQIADHLEANVQCDTPLNIHLTGCPHSCAQHYIGDIGLLGTKVEVGEEMVEGYRIFLGGGYGDQQAIGREIFSATPASDLPRLLEKLLHVYHHRRRGPEESFQQFTTRFQRDDIENLVGASPVLQECLP